MLSSAVGGGGNSPLLGTFNSQQRIEESKVFPASKPYTFSVGLRLLGLSARLQFRLRNPAPSARSLSFGSNSGSGSGLRLRQLGLSSAPPSTPAPSAWSFGSGSELRLRTPGILILISEFVVQSLNYTA